MKELIELIEKMRMHLGMTKRELSLKAEITEEYYWRIISGKAPGCAYEIIDKLAQEVGIKLIKTIDLEVIERVKSAKIRKK